MITVATRANAGFRALRSSAALRRAGFVAASVGSGGRRKLGGEAESAEERRNDLARISEAYRFERYEGRSARLFLEGSHEAKEPPLLTHPAKRRHRDGDQWRDHHPAEYQPKISNGFTRLA